MGRFKNFFVEEAPQEEIEVSDYEYEESIDVNTENVTQDNLIGDIYDANDLSDVSKSIFKVEELLNSLPKEMPNDTKKTTVLSILGSFGLTVDEVVADGEGRIEVINGSFEKIKSDNEEVITDNSASIEQKKIEIQELEKDNSDRTQVIKDTRDKVDSEAKRINDLIKFIKGE